MSLEIGKDVNKQDWIEEELGNGILLRMRLVEGDTFLMGDNQKDVWGNVSHIHQVTLDDYYIGQIPVTQEQYGKIIKDQPNLFFFNGLDRPVDSVSWKDADEFVNRLNDKTGRSYRLPTEAEWEYAARSGKDSVGFAYSGSSLLKEVGWYNVNSHQETKDVALRQPNKLGLYDMSGNVWEWCQDWYGPYPNKPQRNPEGPEEGENRVMRGGSWNNNEQNCRVTNRNNWRPDKRNNNIGFRLALSL